MKFNHSTDFSKTNYDIILFHDKALLDQKNKEIITKSKLIKICASNKNNFSKDWDANLKLPTTITEINGVVESLMARKIFNQNSSIKVKKYLLNKNEKKLINSKNLIILTEKEVRLIQLLLISTKPVSKDKILSSVWNYSSDADTHTVETHIYRLRKKISKEFNDDTFIQNNKEGYYL